MLPELRHIRIYVTNPFYITGIPHIHSAGYRLPGRERLKTPLRQECRHRIVTIGCRQEPVRWHSRFLCHHAGSYISEIPAGHTKMRLIGIRKLRQSTAIIEHLRQQTPDVDSIGRTEAKLILQYWIRKSLLDHGLAIVKSPFHFQSRYVAANSGQLLLLKLADFPAVIQQAYIDSFSTLKSAAYSTACTARVGNKNRNTLSASLRMVIHQPRHITGSKVFKSEGWAVKEL